MTNRNEQNTKASSAAIKAERPRRATQPQAAVAPREPAPPKTWDEIKVGSLVIAQDSHDEGWWEAVVSQIAGDMLTLRWRDYPRYAAFLQNRHQVALLSPGK